MVQGREATNFQMGLAVSITLVEYIANVRILYVHFANLESRRCPHFLVLLERFVTLHRRTIDVWKESPDSGPTYAGGKRHIIVVLRPEISDGLLVHYGGSRGRFDRRRGCLFGEAGLLPP